MMQNAVKLKDGTLLPRIGMGTRFMGNLLSIWERELEALRAGIDVGIKVIDTAEMYGEGRSEQLVGQAINKYNREDVFLISKVLPDNAGRKRIRRSLRHSLKLLRTEYLDLYLFHLRCLLKIICFVFRPYFLDLV